MKVGAREGLLARIQRPRRPATERTASERPDGGTSDPHGERVHALEARVAYLEQLLEGLQDSVHRESKRHATLIAELQAQIQPGTMGASLAQDARDRGL